MFNLKLSGIIAGIAFLLSFLIGILSRTTMPMLILRPLFFAVIFFIISALIYILLRTFLPELLENDVPQTDSGLLPGSRINITEGDTPDFPPAFNQSSDLDEALGSTQGFSQDDTQRDSLGSTQELSQGPAAPPQKHVFIGALADDSEDGIGNITDLMGKYAAPEPAGSPPLETLDQNAQDGYTKAGDMGGIPKSGQMDQFGSGFNADGAAEGVGQSGIPGSVDVLPDLDSMAGAFMPASMGKETDTANYSVSAPSKKPLPGRKNKEWAGDFNAKDMAAGLRTIINKEKEG